MRGTNPVQLTAKGLFVAFVPQLVLRVFRAAPSADLRPPQQRRLWSALVFCAGRFLIQRELAIGREIDDSQIENEDQEDKEYGHALWSVLMRLALYHKAKRPRDVGPFHGVNMARSEF